MNWNEAFRRNLAELETQLQDQSIIRDVTTRQRDAVVREILAPLEESGIPLGLVQSSDEARTLLEKAGVLEPSETTR